MSVHSLLHSVAHALDVKLLGVGDDAVPRPRHPRKDEPDPTPESVLTFLEQQLQRGVARSRVRKGRTHGEVGPAPGGAPSS